MRSQPDSRSSFAFEVGQYFTVQDTCFRIAEERGGLLILEHNKTLQRKAEALSSLTRQYTKGQLLPGDRTSSDVTPPPRSPFISPETVMLEGLPLDMSTPAQSRHVRSVMTYITELRKLGYRSLRPTPLLALDFERLLAKKSELVRLSLDTVYNWSRALDRADGDVRAILPDFTSRGGRGQARTSDAFEVALASAFDALDRDEKQPIKAVDVLKDVETLMLQAVGPERTLAELASRSTIERRIKARYTPYEIDVRNLGEKPAKQKYRDCYPRDKAEGPLDVVEFDDKDTRTYLIDEISGLPYGRGYITSGVDQASRVPLGFSISEMHRSCWSALNAFTAAVLPKDKGAPEFELVKSDVTYFGTMAIALFDNALYNHAPSMESNVHDVGATPAWAKPFKPTEKSVVEDFNGRMVLDFLAKYAGFGGPKSSKDSLDEAERCANAGLNDFKKHFYKWVYDEYVHKPGVDGLTPCQRWNDKMRLYKARLPIDVYRLKILPTLRARVALRPEGILFTGLIYQNGYLNRMKHNLGDTAQVEFRFNPVDLSVIYVFDPITRRLFVCPSANPEYTTGLTLYQQRLIRKMQRQRGCRNPSIPQMLASREELRLLVSQLRFSKKMRERLFARKAGETSASRPKDAQKSPRPERVIVTELEAQVGDIDDVEMEALDEGWELPEMV